MSHCEILYSATMAAWWLHISRTTSNQQEEAVITAIITVEGVMQEVIRV